MSDSPDSRSPDPASAPPAPWFLAHAGVLPRSGRAVDVACGAGRHARWLAGLGLEVVALDRDRDALSGLRSSPDGVIRGIRCDLEAEGWPFDATQRFEVVLVSRYLWRPLLPRLVDAVAPDGGVLLYETFGVGNERYGRPRNPDFLLRPGELLEAVAGRLQVVAYQHGLVGRGEDRRVVQRLVATAAPAEPPLPG